MPILIPESMLGDINTISIPTDAIFTVSLLIVFALIGYFFDNILCNDTSQFDQRQGAAYNLELVQEELEDQLALEVTTLDQKNEEKPRQRKVNFLPTAKFLGLSSFAVLGIGGASLLGVQNMQKSYEGVSSSRANVKLENQSNKNNLSGIDLKSFNKMQKNLKQIRYIDSFLSTIKSSKNNHIYQIKEKQIENVFSF